MFCPSCGAESPDGDRFCRTCGGSLATPAAPPTPRTAPLATSDPAQIGKLFADRYEVKRELGRGGMGIVYEAIDTRLKDRIALKVLMPHHAANPTVYERFLQEVRTARALTHPNIVKVYDLGEASNTVYFTMEYLEGRDLDEILTEEGIFDVDTAIEILGQVCAALDVSHKANLVHRDVKPENIFMTLAGEIKVLDFGVAKVLDGSTTGMTGSMIGTPSYMAPEQVSQGGKVDHWTDTYALGVVCFKMLTGRLPFPSSDPIEAALQHIHALPPPPRSLNPAIPTGVENAILRALAKDPTRRHPSALAFADDLRHAAGLGREPASKTIDLAKLAPGGFRSRDPRVPAVTHAAGPASLPLPALPPQPAAPPPHATTAPPRQAPARAMSPGAPLFPAPPSARWSVISQGRIVPDLDRPTIEQWIAAHKLTATDHAKVDGGKWYPLESFPDFVDALGAVVPEEQLPAIVPEPVQRRVRQQEIARALVWVVLTLALVGGYGWMRLWLKAISVETELSYTLGQLYYAQPESNPVTGKTVTVEHYATARDRSEALHGVARNQKITIRADEARLILDKGRSIMRWVVPVRIPVMFVPIRRVVSVESTALPLREKQLARFYSDPPDLGLVPEGFTWDDARGWFEERSGRAPAATPGR